MKRPLLGVVTSVLLALACGPDLEERQSAGQVETRQGESLVLGQSTIQSARQSGESFPAPDADEVRCRCAPRDLADYYHEADEVLFARLEGWEESEAIEEDLRLRMVVVARPWKRSDRRKGVSRPDGRITAVTEGDTVDYLTAISSASCGVHPVPDGIYVIFASPAHGSDTELRINSCSGTRVHLAEPGGEPVGFRDVPGPFVARQMDALSGLDALGEVAESAPDETDPENESLVGLLDLKALAHGGNVPMRDRPVPEGSVVATVESWAEVDSREVGYEVPAAVVLARADGWYRVRLTNPGADTATAWVAPEDAGTWFPYPELPLRRLSYLTGSWTGHVWPNPGAGIPARSPLHGTDPRQEYAARVHDSTMVGGMPWFRVDLLTTDGCGDGEIRTVLSGWIPAYGADGGPVAWYYSRGC